MIQGCVDGFTRIPVFLACSTNNGRRSGLMVSVLDTGSSGPGLGPGQGHCVVFLDKTLYSHECLSPPRCINGYR